MSAVNFAPVLFSGELVRSILSGSKSQTRRPMTSANSLVNGYPPCRREEVIGAWPSLDFGNAWTDAGSSPAGNPGPYLKVPGGDNSVHRVYSRIQPGDVLWVRETWRLEVDPRSGERGVRYRADNDFVPISNTAAAAEAWVKDYENGKHKLKWRPSIFMRQWASRLTLEVSTVRAERLQDILETDAQAEGVDLPRCSYVGRCNSNRCPRHGLLNRHTLAFQSLWDRVYPAPKSWSDNPWVWVVQFRALPSTNSA